VFQAVIFDAYGTLFDTKDGSVSATADILRKNRSALNPRAVYARWKEIHKELIAYGRFMKEEQVFLWGLRRLYQELGIKGDPEEDVKIMLNTLGVRDAFPETVGVLKDLMSRLAVYIGSNSDEQPLVADIRRNGVTVHGHFSSETLAVYKPDPEFYLSILRRIGMGPDDVLYVGDSPVEDVWGPGCIGIKSVWVNRKGLCRPSGIPEPYAETDSLSELSTIIQHA